MDKRKITESAIDLIDVEYVKNAAVSLDARQKKATVQRKIFQIMMGIAAVVVLLILSIGILQTIDHGNKTPQEADSYAPSSKEKEQTESGPEETTVTAESQTAEELAISTEIRVNRISSEMSAGYRYYSESIYDFIPQSLAELSAYFGKDLTGISFLQGYNILHTTEFIYTKDEGKLVFDISHVVYEGASKTITISMSKMMKPHDCFYLYDEDQYSIIEGMQVLIGENAKGTHVVADFETDEVFYRVQMDGIIDLDLLAKCISELIR